MVNIFGGGLDRMGYLLSKKQKFDVKSYYQVVFYGNQFGRPRFQRSSLFAWTVVRGKVLTVGNLCARSSLFIGVVCAE